MAKKLIGLTENDLHRIIMESITSVLGVDKDNYTNEILEKYGNPPYVAYFRYEGEWRPCNDPNDLEDYIIDADGHYDATMGECGKVSIYNNDGEEIYSIG